MFVVARPGGAWELRETHSTDRGPRARTLASFRVLTPAVLARATQRAGAQVNPAVIRGLALRAGAPVEDSPADAAAASLLGAIGRQDRLASHWRLVLGAALSDPGVDSGTGEGAVLSDSERAALAWVGATSADRGLALADALRLVDAVPAGPSRRQRARLRFPRLHSSERSA